jgi:hypothetical protein
VRFLGVEEIAQGVAIAPPRATVVHLPKKLFSKGEVMDFAVKERGFPDEAPPKWDAISWLGSGPFRAAIMNDKPTFTSVEPVQEPLSVETV